MKFWLKEDGTMAVDEWQSMQEFSEELLDTASPSFLWREGDIITIRANGQTARYRITERRVRKDWPDGLEGKRSVFVALESVD